MRLYLAHPFDARKRIRVWELDFERRFPKIELFNPFYDAPGRTDIEEIDAGRTERYKKLIPEELVKRDLLHIRQGDAIVAIIDGSLSYGTIQEIVYAFIYGMSIYLVITNGHENHPWLRYHANKIFTSIEDFESFITV